MTGTRKRDSSWVITVTGSDEDDERMNRSRCDATTSALLGARSRMAWCMVGTPEYQVGCTSASQEKNLSALNPGVQHTSPPAESGASNAAINPWMWKSGMITRPRSLSVNARDSRTFAADAHTFFCASGTILGRDVVPDVWSTKATSSGVAALGARRSALGSRLSA